MKNSKLLIKELLLVLTIGSIILSGCGNQPSSLDTDIAIPVKVEEIKLKSIEQYLNTTGTVYSTHEILLKAELSGKYKLQTNPRTGRQFALGDLVNEGEIIIVLEDQEYENNITIKSKELNLETTKNEVEQQKKLLDMGGATPKDYKNAESSYINADYALKNAKIQLAKMNIKAPFKGVIVELPYYTPNGKVDNGLDMVKLMNYSQLYLEVNMPEKDINTVKINQNVRILNYTLPNDTIVGIITQLSPVINPDTRTFLGSIIVNNPKLLLRPGMFVKAEIITSRKDSVIVIPKDIIMSKQRGKTVFIVENGAAQERRITFGLENPEEVEIIRGLNADERLVIEGFETLRSRSKVSIIR
ncbi:efflux RND transporter periplasmic adaptor subunit [Bacteroidota bacterium]